MIERVINLKSFFEDARAGRLTGIRCGEVPYAVAVVKLEEGLSLLGRVVDIPFEALRAGLPVRFRPVQIDSQTVIGFGPA